MVFIDELLVLGVLEVVLRHCVHVVEPEQDHGEEARMMVIILTGFTVAVVTGHDRKEIRVSGSRCSRCSSRQVNTRPST